ncbi:MAG: ribosome-associated translation inhibitor RaiA [Syntrophobacterales bacterium]|jgi:putative sigma-54 modulation protein|nr:ribosome-associated translation inhibitor RaiA [Syntrophobacterales bacterium]
MQISVTFRQIEPSEALKNYVTDRLSKFQRYLDGPVEAHVVLGLEKFRHLADVTIDNNGRIIKGKEENTDMYAAIDLVMDKIDMQLKKFRDKLRTAKGDRSRPAPVEPAEADETPPLPAVRRKRVEVPALRLTDAVELMQSSGDDLLVFTSVPSGTLNVLYRRQDGGYILVEPDLG